MASNSVPDFAVDEKYMPATECAIKELFEGIDAIYFTDDNSFNSIRNELKKISDPELEIEALERERFKLKRQMQVVSKKITSAIAKNSCEYNMNVENYDVIRKDAEELLHSVRKFRRSVEVSRRKCRASLHVLSSEYKKAFSCKLRQQLSFIRTLHKSEIGVKELVREGDISGFVQIAVEAINAMKQFIGFNSIEELSKKLVLMLDGEISRMDVLLAAEVRSFHIEQYAFLYVAYGMIGKLERTSSKLHELFKENFQSHAHLTLVEFIQNNNENLPTALENQSYDELCRLVEQQHCVKSLIELGTMLCKLLANYHAILRFHMAEDEKQCKFDTNEEMIETDRMGSCSESGIEIAEPFMIVEKGIFQKSLLDNMQQTFATAANFYDSLLLNIDLTHLKFDQFLKIIEISERFRCFGQRHFCYQCPKIASTLERKSIGYFKQYHLERMEELKMFLQNETFTLCPVPIQFTIFDLPEFHFLKESSPFDNVVEQPTVGKYLETDSEKFSTENFILIETNSIINEVFPPGFEQIDNSPSHSLKYQTSISCDTPEVEDDDARFDSFPIKSMPNLCNTALMVLRIIGRYLKMSKLLQCTADQMIDSIFQLYNSFIHTLFNYFCTDVSLQQQQQIFCKHFSSLRLRQLIESINLSSQQDETEIQPPEEENAQFPTNSLLDLNNTETLFSLAERIIGIESTIFLSKQMELLRPVLEKLSPTKESHQKLDSFYRILLTTSDLLEATLGCVAAKALPYASISKQILATDWNITEIPSRHSTYMDTILEEIGQFKNKLFKLYPYVHISEELHHCIWSMLCMCITRTLVQAYSEVKKCSPEGRALQLIDVAHFCSNLEEMSGVRPLPHRSYVESYVKAFYLPFDELSQWIVHHTEYTLNQTSALLNASTSRTTKKTPAMSRLMMNLLDASGMGEGSNSLFQ